MANGYGLKLKQVRVAEKLTQRGFSAFTGISLGAIRNYETGQGTVGLTVLDRVIKHPALGKYTLWLMLDMTATEIGQISPTVKNK